MRRLTRVDLPVPEGPDRTTGRSFDEGFWDVGAIVENVLMLKNEEETTKGSGREVGNEPIEAVRHNAKANFGLMGNFKLE
jgi:hypothetical protein